MMNTAPHCIIVSRTVTALCGPINTNDRVDCMTPATLMKTEAIPTTYKSFSGTITTTNVIMANWSKDMWQSVVNRAVRMIASGPLATHFFSAFANIS
ncbi:hypothetical protein KIN20_030989 [Parelaphostrongylus tenuis]|uniref:Uncharacterized protein n=1 Tax=Parelaphostrongylus tenuis TaxID=148309 RepID=A0AAD5R4P2_PARTN|nr:hypothetical protein KIN20_030989 [Parelaphostrongylus tenuis]